MIGSKEAEVLTYLQYKTLFWERMGAYWRIWLKAHPDQSDFLKERIVHCDKQLAHWRRVSGLPRGKNRSLSQNSH